MLDAEARAPEHRLDRSLPARGAARVEECGDVGSVGCFRRVLHRRDNAEAAVGQRRHHDHSVLGEEQRDFLAAERPAHPDVGEDEGFRVRFAVEGDAGGLAHQAAHAVAGDDVAGRDDLLAGGRAYGDAGTGGVLSDGRGGDAAVDGTAERRETVGEHTLGDVLGQHQHELVG